MSDEKPHYRRTNGAMADCKICGGEGWIDCSEIGREDVRCTCVTESAAEPAPTHRRRAVIGRVVLWGLYRRAIDGDYLYESWLWGAFKRCRLSPIKFMRARTVVGDVRTEAVLDYANRTLRCIDGTTLEFRNSKLVCVVSKEGQLLFESGSYTKAGEDRLRAGGFEPLNTPEDAREEERLRRVSASPADWVMGEHIK